MTKRIAGSVLALAATLHGGTALAQEKPSSEEMTAIAKEAAVYALPMLMNYGVMY